jgi:hypothetical protein
MIALIGTLLAIKQGPEPFSACTVGLKMVWSMIALSGTFLARESCDQTRTWTIFGLHGRAENGQEHDHAERNVPSS